MRIAGLADPTYAQTSGSVRLTLTSTAVDREPEARLPEGSRELARHIREAGRASTGGSNSTGRHSPSHPYPWRMRDRTTRTCDVLHSHRAEILEITKRHGVTSISVFGSVARGADTDGSDVDFLVELGTDVRPFHLTLGVALEDLLGFRVHIGTVDTLKSAVRYQVLAEAVQI